MLLCVYLVFIIAYHILYFVIFFCTYVFWGTVGHIQFYLTYSQYVFDVSELRQVQNISSKTAASHFLPGNIHHIEKLSSYQKHTDFPHLDIYHTVPPRSLSLVYSKHWKIYSFETILIQIIPKPKMYIMIIFRLCVTILLTIDTS